LPAGRLTFQVLGAVAEFEREMLRERVRSGMAQARRAGKSVGRPAKRSFLPIEVEKMKVLRSQGARFGIWQKNSEPAGGWRRD
jgi:putative DNA-invertase from lambdoid prophage Rac